MTPWTDSPMVKNGDLDSDSNLSVSDSDSYLNSYFPDSDSPIIASGGSELSGFCTALRGGFAVPSNQIPSRSSLFSH